LHQSIVDLSRDYPHFKLLARHLVLMSEIVSSHISKKFSSHYNKQRNAFPCTIAVRNAEKRRKSFTVKSPKKKIGKKNKDLFINGESIKNEQHK